MTPAALCKPFSKEWYELLFEIERVVLSNLCMSAQVGKKYDPTFASREPCTCLKGQCAPNQIAEGRHCKGAC